ncbi:MAG: dihydropteroate synthase [Candidatus Omnitrophica bacterium]|nr:dihydropteroate synthase [Candidatus Omnitrophota bacterium]
MPVLTRSAAQPLSSRRPAARRLTIPCGRTRLVCRGRPLVMGILNVTPDSFSDGGHYADPEAALMRAIRMEAEGADLIDVGGESTRPGSAGVPAAEELRRVMPVIERLARTLRIPVSVDTAKAEVAERAFEAGASILNDVTALRHDPRMAGVAARAKAAVILMHMRGTPRTMQRAPRYRDVVEEVAGFLQEAALRAQVQGIARNRLLIDPGLGFGKTVTHNLELMRSLDRFVALGMPVVAGPSRKSFIGKVLEADVPDRLVGTLACVAQAQRCGVHIVRVHDVGPAVQLIHMLEAIEASHAARG